MRVTNLGSMSLVLNVSEWKSMFGLLEDLQPSTEQSQMVICDPDTQKVIPEAFLVDWIKATIRCAYLRRRTAQLPL